MKGFGRDPGAESGREGSDPVDEARIADLFTGDKAPEDLETDDRPAVRAAARWVRSTRDALRATGPDPEFVARLRRGLPVGTPGSGAHRPAWRRPGSWITAACLLVVAGVAWQFRGRPGADGPEEPAAPLPTASLGVAHVSSLDGARSRTALHLDGASITTGADEEARVHFSPWRTSPYPSEDELTIVTLDPDSKLNAQLYRPGDEPAYGMRQAMFLERSVGLPIVESAILEITMLRGTAEIVHHGEPTELRFPDMILVTPLRPVVKTGEEDARLHGSGILGTTRRPPDPGEHANPRPAVVHGTVSEAGSGIPVTRFEIVAWPLEVLGAAEDRWEGSPPAPITFESADGSYRIVELEPGSYRFFARTPSHVLAASEEVDLLDGTARRLDFALRPGHTVLGRVLDARTKRPVPGARVRFIAHAAEDSLWKHRDAYGTVFSGADGTYRCTNRPGGRQSMWVLAEGYGSLRFGPIHVRRDGPPLRDIDVFLEPEARIAGRVTPWRGTDPKALSVVVNSLGPFDPGRSLLGEDLTYSVRGLAAGKHAVHLVLDRNTALATKVVEVAAGESAVVDFGTAGTRVHGLVRDEAGRPLGELEVSFYQTERTWRRRAPSYRTTTDAAGRFEAWLPPGESFQVRLRRRGDLETWSVYGPTCTVPATDPEEPFLIELQGQEVSGQITGASLEGVWRTGSLFLRDTTVAGRRWTTELLDAGGHFAFPYVPAGTYRLSGVLRDHVVEEQILRIGLGGRCGVDLGVIHQARVVLRLIDEEGNVLSRLDVRSIHSLGADGDEQRHWMDSGERGIVVYGLTPGPARLRVESLEHGEIVLTHTLEPDRVNEIERRIERGR